MHTQQMVNAHPDVRGSTSNALIKCIDECHACAQACLSCADACIGEEMVARLKQCIRLNLDCADVCDGTAKLASRRTGSDESLLRDMLEICARACAMCADECAKHADHHEHCRICASDCRDCQQACELAMGDVGDNTASAH